MFKLAKIKELAGCKQSIAVTQIYRNSKVTISFWVSLPIKSINSMNINDEDTFKLKIK